MTAMVGEDMTATAGSGATEAGTDEMVAGSVTGTIGSSIAPSLRRSAGPSSGSFAQSVPDERTKARPHDPRREVRSAQLAVGL
jgi:hypothetical protein